MLGTATQAIDFSPLNNPPPSNAFGTGRFFQGLLGEIQALEKEDLMLAGFEPAKYSSKKNGIIAAYGANTNQGIVRYKIKYNLNVGTTMRTV